MFLVFYTKFAYLCIYDLFHILLSVLHTYGSKKWMYVCVYVYMYILYLMGFLAISCFSMSRGLACCINPQPGGPGDFLSRFSSPSPWYASIKLQGSSASFGSPQVFYIPGTRHIWWVFPYLPSGEAPDRRLDVETLNNLLNNNILYLQSTR